MSAAPKPATFNIDIVLACWVCTKPGHRCSRCKLIVYCSTECQKADWKRHASDCKPRPANDPEPILKVDNPFSRYMAKYPKREKQIYSASRFIGDDHLLFLHDDGWTTCEADGAVLAFYLDKPANVTMVLDEHAKRAKGSTSVVVRYYDEHTWDAKIYYAQFIVEPSEATVATKDKQKK